MLVRLSVTPLVVLALAACTPAGKPAPVAPSPVVTYSKDAKFENVRDDLQIAITNRGLVIDSTSLIHNMLERTGKDLGATTTIFVDGQAFSFCSAAISRRTMEADPHNIAFCPYTVTVYTPVNEPNKVYVSYRRPWRPDGSEAAKDSLKEVEALLDGIARETLNIK